MQAAYEHNAQPITREAFYAIACDPACSVEAVRMGDEANLCDTPEQATFRGN